MRALSTSATGMVAQQFNLNVVANNLANVNTQGFKRQIAHFQDLLYQNIRIPGGTGAGGTMVPNGTQIGLGVSSGTTTQVFTQGTFQLTDNDFDMAISGEGFFRVLMPDGTTAYTRDGALGIDGQGRLVTQEGYPIQPEIIVPPDRTSFNIAPDGTVMVSRPGQPNEAIGRIELTRFTNPAGLVRLGGNLYVPTPAAGDAVNGPPGENGIGSIKHKFLEMPNLEVIEEMIRLITIQRAFESNSKAVQTADEMLQTANNLKR